MLLEGCPINRFIRSWERGTLQTRSWPWMLKDVCMTTPRDWDKYCMNVREDPINELSPEWSYEWTSEWNLLGGHCNPLQPATKNSPTDHSHMAPYWEYPATWWYLFPPMRRRDWCELSSAEAGCHAGSGASPFENMIRKCVLNMGVGICVAPNESDLSVYSETG